jgi:hypothetical protein
MAPLRPPRFEIVMNRGAPRDEQPFDKLDQRIKNDADDREDKQRGKCERRIEILIGDEDQVANPRLPPTNSPMTAPITASGRRSRRRGRASGSSLHATLVSMESDRVNSLHSVTDGQA